jgi:hypothetical protein
MDCRSPGWRLPVFQNHWIDDLSAKDTSPPPEIFVRAVEFLVNHIISAAMALHGNLLFPLEPLRALYPLS